MAENIFDNEQHKQSIEDLAYWEEGKYFFEIGRREGTSWATNDYANNVVRETDEDYDDTDDSYFKSGFMMGYISTINKLRNDATST